MTKTNKDGEEFDHRWNVRTASECIQRNGGHVSVGQIQCSSPGLKVLGAIDFLTNHHKYVWIRR